LPDFASMKIIFCGLLSLSPLKAMKNLLSIVNTFLLTVILILLNWISEIKAEKYAVNKLGKQKYFKAYGRRRIKQGSILYPPEKLLLRLLLKNS